MGTTLPSPDDLFHGLKRLENEAKHSTPSDSEVYKEWTFTCLSAFTFIEQCLAIRATLALRVKFRSITVNRK
jgi:hypothetical protein